MKPIDHDSLPVTHYPLTATIPTATQICFFLFLGLLLLSHASATNPGPVGWFAHPKLFTTFSWQIGPLALLPLFIVIGWIYSWQTVKQDEQSTWSWGLKVLTLPLLILTLLTIIHVLTGSSIILLNYIFLFWFIYLFLLNPPPAPRPLIPLLPATLLVALYGQSLVAIFQFVLQRPLNLIWLGEPAMDLATVGTSVVTHNGTNWLRAYGLTSHPNQLGLLLVTLILLLWPYQVSFHRVPTLFWLGLTLGILALLMSWSRSAWLALGVATAVHLLAWYRKKENLFISAKAIISILLGTAVIFVFLFYFRDILMGRFLLQNSTLEARSLFERQRDFNIALQLLATNPFLGTGLGNYLQMAARISPAAQIVHNVPLLLGVEFGLLGLLCWIIFLVAPLTRRNLLTHFVGETAVWLALITISIWQPEPHIFLPKGAIIWALAAAAWSKQPQSKPTMRLTYV